MMTALAVPGGFMRPHYDEGDAATTQARPLADDADVQRHAGSDTIPAGYHGRSSYRGRSSHREPGTARPPLVPVGRRALRPGLPHGARPRPAAGAGRAGALRRGPL